jgi:Putative DNA-binding domain
MVSMRILAPVKPEEIEALLTSEESETLERKQGLDKDAICKSLIAFANDMYGHGGGCVVVGQAPDKSLVGLQPGGDEIQRIISDLARNNCSPAVPVSVECYEKDGKRLAIVEIPASPARPHFTGKAWVRMGSTTRQATDSEIILLRAVEENRKIAILKWWLDEGKTNVVLWQMAPPSQGYAHSLGVEQVKLLEVNENWIVLHVGGSKRAFPFDEFNVGWDPEANLPQIRYHGRA